MVKKLLTYVGGAALALALVLPAYAARTDSVWDISGNYVVPICTGGCSVLITGTNKYLNFGASSGSSGYGLRDNAGTVEFKNSGGAWAALGSGGAATTTINQVNGPTFTFSLASSSGAFAISTSSASVVFTFSNNLAAFANDVGFITTSTNLGVSNFASANISQWTNNSGYITTSTGLVVGNFASANISQWTNNSGYITTSTGLTVNNFATTSVSQWNNDAGYITTSTPGNGTIQGQGTSTQVAFFTGAGTSTITSHPNFTYNSGTGLMTVGSSSQTNFSTTNASATRQDVSGGATFGAALTQSGGVVALASTTITGNTTTTRLSVSGLSALASTTASDLTITNNTTSGALKVSGLSALASTTATWLSVTGNTTSGALSVSGLSALASTTISDLSVTNNTTSGALKVTGLSALASTTASNLTVTANTTSGALTVSGLSALASTTVTWLTNTGNTTSGALSVSGLSALASTTSAWLTVTNNTTSGALTVSGLATFVSSTITNLIVTNATATVLKDSQGNAYSTSTGSGAGASTTKAMFGGDGSDGALNITSASTTIDLANATSVTKYYTSIIVTSTGALAFSSPNASGTIITIKVTGNVTLAGSQKVIDFSMMGGAGGAGGSGGGSGGANDGGGGASMAGNGSPSTASASTGGGDGSRGAGFGTYGLWNITGGEGGKGTVAQAAAGGVSTTTLAWGGSHVTNTQLFKKYIIPGSGGGGGAGNVNGIGGAGGRGAGALIMEVRGTFDFPAGTVWGVGQNATSTGGRCNGGGGGGGAFIVFANTVSSTAGTITLTGGDGGDASCGVNDPDGANGFSAIITNDTWD